MNSFQGVRFRHLSLFFVNHSHLISVRNSFGTYCSLQFLHTPHPLSMSTVKKQSCPYPRQDANLYTSPFQWPVCVGRGTMVCSSFSGLQSCMTINPFGERIFNAFSKSFRTCSAVCRPSIKIRSNTTGSIMLNPSNDG